MKVESFMGNLNGTLHGGAISTIIDVSTTIAVMSLDKKNRATVSADLSISFMASAAISHDVYILSQVDRIGKNLAFTQCWLYNEKKELLVTGRHLKAFLDSNFNLDGETSYPKK